MGVAVCSIPVTPPVAPREMLSHGIFGPTRSQRSHISVSMTAWCTGFPGPCSTLAPVARLRHTGRRGRQYVVFARKFTPEQALSTIARERVTVATFGPDDAYDVAATAGSVQTYDLSSLRLITYGKPYRRPKRYCRNASRRLPHDSPFGGKFRDGTELSPVATMLGAERTAGSPPGRLRPPDGRSIPGGSAHSRCRRP